MAYNDPLDRSTIRRPRACVPCHERKVKCNAGNTGLPCSRCIQHGRVATCQLVPLPDRSSARLKHSRRQGSSTRAQQVPGPLSGRTISNHTSSLDQRERINDVHPSSPLFASTSQGSSTGFLSGVHRPTNFGTCTAPITSASAANFGSQCADTNGVSEEDSQLETCLRIAQARDGPGDPATEQSLSHGREVFTYHGGVDSTTILAQALSHQNPRKFVRLLLRDSQKGVEPNHGSVLDAKSTEYLRSVGAFDVPALAACEKLVRLYFERLFPYLPVLDRLPLMRQLSEGTYSTFLLQCIFASVVPYASPELLAELGYANRPEAQKALFSKAQLLYDLGAERSQLSILQGSLVLTSSYFAFGLDKDLRYWLGNAVRIATQMGLHRRQIVHQLLPGTRSLFSRIFWVMYSRDIIMVMAGRLNVRALDDRFLDTAGVTEEDWEEEPEDQLARFGLTPISALEKKFLVHNSRLAQICARYIELFRIPDVAPTRASCKEIESRMVSWRRDLPPELQHETVEHWSHDNVWILVLRAMAYRLECLLYRDTSGLPDDKQGGFGQRAAQKQRNAMLELDAILRRIMLYDLIEFCPFSMTTCASTIIAMHIECAMCPATQHEQRQLSQTSIHDVLAFLRTSSRHWDSVRWSLRMFDAIVARARLYLASSEHPMADLSSMRNLPLQPSATVDSITDDPDSRTAGQDSRNPTLIPDLTDTMWAAFPIDVPFSEPEPAFQFEFTAQDAGLEGDFNEILIEDMFSTNSLQTWAHGM